MLVNNKKENKLEIYVTMQLYLKTLFWLKKRKQQSTYTVLFQFYETLQKQSLSGDTELVRSSFGLEVRGRGLFERQWETLGVMKTFCIVIAFEYMFVKTY